jgi:hypothetical protein
MDAQVYVTLHAETEFAALIAKAGTDEEVAELHRSRELLFRILSDLKMALREGITKGYGQGRPQAMIRWIARAPLAVEFWIYVEAQKIWITHFVILSANWPRLKRDD